MRIVLLFIFFLVYSVSWAQTCCSAGAQVSSIYTIPNEDGRAIAVNFAYEYSSINLLIDQNERLVNDPRTRFGQSFIAKVDYVVNPKLSFSATLPIVHQSRKTISSQEQSIGIGDALFMGQYTFISNQQFQLNASGGIKLPTGITSQRSQGIFLSPDMQSGSGSVDYVVLVGASKKNVFSPFSVISFQSYYRNNGVNNSFAKTELSNGRRFGFGDEFSSVLTYQYTFVHPRAFITPDINLKVRAARANIELETLAPNSGGTWLSLPFGLTYRPDEEKMFRVYAEIPLYQRLVGLQISTSFNTGVQFRYLFNDPFKKRKNNENINLN